MLALFIIALVIQGASLLITVSGKLFAALNPLAKCLTVVFSLTVITALVLGIIHF